MAAIAVGLVVGALGAQRATAQEAAPTRTVVVGSVALDTGEVLTVALHPSDAPIQLHAPAGLALEACPGLLDGGAPVPGASSWPSWTGFDSCRAFGRDGSLALPSTGVDTFHLAFLVQGRGAARTKVARLEIAYTPGDGYFEVLPPPIEPGARGPRVSVMPMSSTTVGAQAYGIDGGRTHSVAVAVRQRGRSVPASEAAPPGGAAQAYGPVRLGSMVRVTSENRGARPARARIAIAWD